MSKGFNIFYHILTFFTIRKTEQKEPDMNHIPQSVTWKLYLSSPKILPLLIPYLPYFNSIFLQTGETPYYHGNLYTITQNSDTITETPDFCLIVRFLPLSPSYQRHPKTKKLGPTTHCDEPHQA